MTKFDIPNCFFIDGTHSSNKQEMTMPSPYTAFGRALPFSMLDTLVTAGSSKVSKELICTNATFK